ncbi:MAG TPA: hypothetical protein VNQ77_10725 [Frankiaceae bacterium]|nr:hypothetical protein [Frankiaceae bacterium]
MNTDEKIAAILKMEGDSVEPSPAGWDAITAGVAARRKQSWWLRGTALAGAAVVVVGAVVYVAADRSQQGIDTPPASTGGPSAEQTVTPSPASQTPAKTPVPNLPIDAIWPLTTTDEVEAWEDDHATYPALETASGSATAFARRYLGLPDATTHALEGNYGENDFEVRNGTFAVSRVTVKGFGEGGTAPFVVIAARTDALTISSPAAGGAVEGSTVRVTGPYEAVDPAIDVTLRADDSGSAPVELAKERATTSEFGFSADLSFTTTRRTGSVLVTLASNKDGSVAAAAAIPVVFGEAPEYAGPKAMVAARDGGIAVISTATGEVVRWLVEGFDVDVRNSDPELSDDGKTVVYVEYTDECSSVVKSVPIAGGTPKTLTGPEQRFLSSPTLRHGKLSYLRGPCQHASDPVEVVVDGKATRVDGRVGGPVAGERFVAYTVTKGRVSTLHTVDIAGELADNPAPAPEGCQWLAPTWGPADAGGRDQLFVAASCSPRDEVVETRLYRFDQDALNRVLLTTLDVLGVTSLDYAGEHLVIGTNDAAAYAWTGQRLRAIPGVADRPTWS